MLSPTSTVLETLLFAAQLRLPEDIPRSYKEQRAHTVLSQLGLEHVAHTRVGSVEHRGISGGEMRRVSIGIELVAAPDVLVLDEPTSGLDIVSGDYQQDVWLMYISDLRNSDYQIAQRPRRGRRDEDHDRCEHPPAQLRAVSLVQPGRPPC